MRAPKLVVLGLNQVTRTAARAFVVPHVEVERVALVNDALFVAIANDDSACFKALLEVVPAAAWHLRDPLLEAIASQKDENLRAAAACGAADANIARLHATARALRDALDSTRR